MCWRSTCGWLWLLSCEVDRGSGGPVCPGMRPWPRELQPSPLCS